MATRISNVVVRRVVIVLCILAPLLVSYARLYRGAHHVSDIVVGMLNGVLCALLAWNYLRREPASGTASSGVETRGEVDRRDRSDPRVAGPGEGVDAVGGDARGHQGQQERPERVRP